MLLKIFLVLVLVSVSAISQNSDCKNGNCTLVDNKETTTKVSTTEQTQNSESTTAPSIFVTAPPTVETVTAKGRAINFTNEEHHTDNGLSSNRSNGASRTEDLSDVSMDEDEDDEMQKNSGGILTAGICVKGGLTYNNGEKIEDGCDTICTCMNGKMDCVDRCSKPFVKKGKALKDPMCHEKPTEDPCCSTLVCAADTDTEPLEICTHQNKTYQRGERYNDGCSQICTCESGGKFNCKPRCKPVNKTSDRCVEVADPNDSCCKMVLCDVTLDDHEHYDKDDIPKLKLLSAKFINASKILLKFDSKLDDNKMNFPQLELSSDRQSWKTFKISKGGFVEGAKPDLKYARLENTDDYVTIQNTDIIKNQEAKKESKTCMYKGEIHKIGDEFYDGCEQFCQCSETGVNCLKMQCPTYFGLDIVDTSCIEWETEPPNFVPEPPNCCPENVRCKSNGSCIYEGEMYQNWQEIPPNVTGCDKRCYCENGKVECQNACPPVTALPPANLPCPQHRANLTHSPDDDCCLTWICLDPDEPPPSTDTEKMKNTKDKPTSDTKIPNKPKPTKTTSNTDFAGPLLIYENDPKNITTNEFSDLQDLHNMDHDHEGVNGVPKDGDEKDHYDNDGSLYHNANPYGIWGTPSKDSRKPVGGDATNDNSPNSFIGPFNPDFKIPVGVTKPKKGNKTSSGIPGGNKQKGGQRVPINGENNGPFQQPQFNSVQRPDEILQIIQQHPELANYPSGSVFEVHNYDSKYPQNRPQVPINPYLINQVDPSNPSHSIPIDQIIKHVQNGQIPPGLTRPQLPFGQNSQQFAQNANVFAPHGLHIPFINGQHNQSSDFPGFPQGFPPQGFPQQSPDDINVQQVEAIDGSTVRLIFSVSSLIVGLHGRVEVRYTNKPDDNLEAWESQVFAPPNDLIATPQLEFDLIGLQPSTEYKIKITIMLRDLHNTPSSRIFTVRTPAKSLQSTLPPMIPIEPNLVITDLNSTWANIVWRKLSDFEAQFVDGVQLRFKEISGKVYAATPLIHRAVTSYTLENLKPSTEYEVGIYFIPFAGQNTELQADRMINFTTTPEYDPYGFNVTLEIQHIKPTSVEVVWSGVPYPEDKYVNIYRAIYQSDTGKGDTSTFKIAKRDSPTKTIIQDLKPGTRYRLWLEVYLTNGKIQTSNVQDFITKPRSAAVNASTGKLSGEIPDHSSDYYGPLVVVAILAALAIMSTLILLLILVKRHNQSKHTISNNTTRVSQSAYDNPTYKVEIQQETMDL